MIHLLDPRESTRPLRLARLRYVLPCAAALGFGFARIMAQEAGVAATGLASPAVATAAPTQAPIRDGSARTARRAEKAYLAGARAIEHHRPARAESFFKKAVALNPARTEYAEALTRTRGALVADLLARSAEARQRNRSDTAEALLAKARAMDPGNEALAPLAAMREPIRIEPRPNPGEELSFNGPLQLAPNAETHEFHLHADAQQVVRDVAGAYGIQVSFDDTVAHADLRFALDKAPYGQAMPILLHMAQLFAVPLTAKSILVAKDTQENRARYERQVEETVYIPASTNEEMGELVNVIKNVFDVKQVSVLNGSGTLLIRAPAETLPVMNATLADLIDGGAEVSMELKLYEVDKTWMTNTGASLPTQVGAFSVASQAQALVNANQSVINQAIASGYLQLTGSATTQLIEEALFLVKSGIATSAQVSGLLAIVGGGISTLGLYDVGGGTVNLSMNASDVRTVDDVQVRVADRQTNTLKIGSKYPITTSTYSTNLSSATTSALAGVTINGQSASSLLAQLTGSSTSRTTSITPQVQYEDLGLTLKTTPVVEKSGAVSMHVELKIEALTGSSLDNNPVLSSRVLTSDVTVAEGTSALIAAAMTKSEMGSLSGLPGLSELPGFQDATGNATEKDSTDLVILLTPHIVRKRSSEIASRRMVFHTSVPQDY